MVHKAKSGKMQFTVKKKCTNSKQIRNFIKKSKKIIIILMTIFCMQNWQLIGMLVSYAGGTTFNSTYDDRDDYIELNHESGRTSVLNKLTSSQKGKVKFINYDSNRILQNEKLSADCYYTLNKDMTTKVFGNHIIDPRDYIEEIKDENPGIAYTGFKLSENTPGQCGFLWQNALTYQGQKIDVKFTFTDWTYYADRDGAEPTIIYTRSQLGRWSSQTNRLKSVKYDMDFLKSGTNEKANFKGVFTVYDIDGSRECNGINLDQIEKLYIQIDPNAPRSETQSTHLDAYYSSPNLYLASKTKGDSHLAGGEDQCPEKQHQYSILVDTNKHPKLTIEFRSTMLSGYNNKASLFVEILNTDQFLPTEINKTATKTVTDANETNATSNTLQRKGEEFTYNVNYAVPRETESYNYYASMYFRDQVDTRLNVNSVKIYAGSTDVTSNFTITNTNNLITATAKNVKTASFYGKTYRMEVKVKYNGTAVTSGSLNFTNTAHVYVNEGDR